ncbi:DNA replication terminus site-binding protein [Pseudoalteromonas aurantia]|uniref:DNA replication terminus site-binding protein n=2 Tax=Pseudoalteromonas TaxID=53246 RepID=A0A5S3UYT6_9GAMM|nr:DNA replication terminus site-binding protein [Pseudoalteromonas aurantia]TMO62966.1 DNA replication terminus site-binding protein [Pseudoalteromonas aurantia]TMO63017.1 DNA replication terminus site-binding protein [Pseudoalteromonas aurantia]TMO75425.1 DNA replication terminus site-binding protein [Pseudoalteromonas aurantia]
MSSSTNQFKLKAHFDHLMELTSLFCVELKQSDVISADYYQLPNITKESEEKAPEKIQVQKITGSKAIDKIALAYKDIFLDEKISGKVLLRHPGIILINDETNTLQARLKEVNKAKEDFKNAILQIENNDARFEAVHSAIPNLMTLAAYRKIHSELGEPYSVRFTWMTKHATRTLTKDAALEMLSKSSNYNNPRMIDQESWLSLVQKEKVRVANLPEKSKLRIRRPTRVSPEVNVRFTAENRYHVSAALPFILFNPSKNTKIGTLRHYEKVENHPRKREYNFLVDRIYLEKVSE